MMTQTTDIRATAAASGAAATEKFGRTAKAGPDTSQERVATLVGEVLAAVHDVIRRHDVTYAEYDALKAWLIRVGADGEWPLFLDVFVESVVEQVTSADRDGTKGTIEGPYYVPGAPAPGPGGALPTRDDEEGTPLVLSGQVRAVSGDALPGATLEIWHADADGLYSQFAPGIPEWNLRGTVTADEQGNFRIRTVRPAPYQIPTDGATGALIRAAGWHAWRPAHLHLKVTAAGHQAVTTQLYLPGDEHIDSDVASAVKPELVLDVEPGAGAGDEAEARYDFVLDPA